MHLLYGLFTTTDVNKIIAGLSFSRVKYLDTVEVNKNGENERGRFPAFLTQRA